MKLNWILFVLAAVFEIGGCYAFWAWLRLEKSPLWILPGIISLIIFALILARIDTVFAGRAFAAYGGVYIVASLAWLKIIEHANPVLSDYLGAALCLVGAAIIIIGPRLSGA